MSPYITLFIKGIKLFFILPFALSSKRVFDVCWNKYYVRPFDKNIFNLCVQWLLYQGQQLGFSYEDINVKIFCIIWPIITLTSLFLNAILLTIILSH